MWRVGRSTAKRGVQQGQRTRAQAVKGPTKIENSLIPLPKTPQKAWYNYITPGPALALDGPGWQSGK